MKKPATVIAVAGLIGTPVLAADLNKPVYKAPPPPPPAPVYTWTGWYESIDIGAAERAALLHDPRPL